LRLAYQRPGSRLPPFDYKNLKCLFGGLVIANNGCEIDETARHRNVRYVHGPGLIGPDDLHLAMKRVGIEAIYRKPNTSKPAPGHKIYPYLLRRAQQGRPAERKAMIDRSHALPIAKQANISRSSAYYLPRLVSAVDLAVMRRMDELHLDYPFAGSRVLRDLLNAEGLEIGRRHVATLVGYILPKLIGALTPGGVVPATLPSEVMSYLSPAVSPRTSTVREQVPPRHIEVVQDKPKTPRWLWPAVAAAALALGAYIFTQRTPEPGATTVAEKAPQPAPVTPAPTLPPRLALNDEEGVIRYSGSVHDDDTRASIVNALTAVFGGDNIKGHIDVDRNRGTMFDGNSVNLGGIGYLDRDRISNALKGLPGRAQGREDAGRTGAAI
jgi:hypothetical protein